MNDLERIDAIIDRLQQLWYAYPNLKFGQLIVGLMGDDYYFSMEDGVWLEAITDFPQRIDIGWWKTLNA